MEVVLLGVSFMSCDTLQALFQAFSYYTFVHRFRWEQLEFSEIPDKIKEGPRLQEAQALAGAPDIPRVYGHYKQHLGLGVVCRDVRPELPPPKRLGTCRALKHLKES